MDDVDCVVVGAGVVGLAVARALALAGREVVVLESEPTFGSVTSARNSEVIHAGIYYPPGSLKARLCVRGRQLLYDYCTRHAVAHRRCGKLIVATASDEVAMLAALREQATANGGHDLVALTAAQAMALEPGLRCVGALLSPSTGIVDSHGLMLALLGEAEAHGALLVPRSPVLAGRVTPQGIELDVGSGAPTRSPSAAPGDALHDASGAATRSAPATTLRARTVVNSAGLGAPALARALRGLPAAGVPREYLAKGCYFTLAGKAPFSRLVYPAPGGAGRSGHLGVHLTLDMAGQARFGPSFHWVDAVDYTVDAAEADACYAEVRRYWPALPDGALQPGYAGVRPRISGPDAPAADFRIDGPAAHGVPGLVNLFGIESPGLTAALAIAECACTALGGTAPGARP